MASPFVSITTATYNCASTLPRTIESVLNQTYLNIDYVIMDGLSKDGTADVARSYIERFEQKGMRLRVFSEADQGMYDAINKAMDLAKGELLGNINGDDYYEPRAAEAMVERYQTAPFDLAYANLRVHTKNSSFIKKAKPMHWATSRCWNHPTTFLAGECARNYRYRLDNLYADFDLFLRARADGCRIEIIDEVLADFVFGGVSNEKSFKKTLERIGWKNEVFKDNKCGPMSYAEGALIEFAKYVKG